MVRVNVRYRVPEPGFGLVEPRPVETQPGVGTDRTSQETDPRRAAISLAVAGRQRSFFFFLSIDSGE